MTRDSKEKGPQKPKTSRSAEPRIVAGRVPPHDLDAEAAVLSAVLLHRPALTITADILRPEHFYSDANGRIFEAALAIASDGRPVDIVTVASWLRDRERLAQIGGPSYLAQIADATPAVANVGAHAATVYEKWRLRRLIATCQKVAAEGYGDVSVVQEFIEATERDILELSSAPPERAVKRRRRSIGDCLSDAFEVMRRRAAGDEQPIPTPWPSVNAKLEGGWWPAFYTLTSATGTGKTQFAIQAAAFAATYLLKRARAANEKPRRVRYIALELGETDLVARVLGHLSGLPWSSLYFGKPIGNAGPASPPEEREAALSIVFRDHQELLEALPLDIEPGDIFGWTWRDLAKIASELDPPAMIILDYTQLAKAPEGAREELRETIANVAKVARKLAQKGIAVLALSSTARANYDRVSGKATEDGGQKRSGRAAIVPGQNDADAAEFIDLGKEAGDLEFTADCVLALIRGAAPPNGQAQKVWLAVAKGRGFPAGWAKPCLLWSGTAFTQGQHDDQEYEAEEPEEPQAQWQGTKAPPRRRKNIVSSLGSVDRRAGPDGGDE